MHAARSTDSDLNTRPLLGAFLKPPVLQVVADSLEEAAVESLFDTLGNPVAMKKAIEAAPNMGKVEKLREQQERLQVFIDRIQQKREAILDLIPDSLTSDQARPKLRELDEQETQLVEKRDHIEVQIENLPTLKSIQDFFRDAAGRLYRVSKSGRRRRDTKQAIREGRAECPPRTWEECRELVGIGLRRQGARR